MAIDREKILEAAQSLVEKKRYDKALVEYQKLVAADHKDARTLLKIAELYLKMERYEQAVPAFEQVAQLHAAAGFALKAIAVYKQAREVVQRHIPHLSERFGHLLTRVAELYVELKLNNDAAQTYEEIAARLEASGRERDALDVLRKIADLDPQNPQRVHRFGEALVRAGDLDGALAPLGSAAETLLARGQREDALAVAERVLQLRADPRMARLAAVIYLERGWPNDGAAALLKIQICYKHSPKDLDTLDLLAKALYALRQPIKALEVHKEAARIARDLGKTDAFDFHMSTLVSRAPNDEVVRKLAAQWSKAPPSMLEPPAPPRAPMPPPAPPMPPHAAPPMPPHAAPPMPPHAAPPMPPPHAMPVAPFASAAAPLHMPPPPPPRGGTPPQRLTPSGPVTPPPRGMTPPQRLTPSGPLTPPPRITSPGPPPRLPHGGPPTPPPRFTPPGAPPPRLPHAGPPTPPPYVAPPPQVAPPPRVSPPQRIAPPPAPPPPPRPPVTPSAPPMSFGELQLDDPADFPLPAPAAAPAAAPALDPGGFGQLDHFGTGDEPPPSLPTVSLPPASLPPAHDAGPVSLSGRGRFDEEAIEEVEFFLSQRMFEDALTVLDEQLARLPNHPLLLDRRRDVEAQAAAAAAGEPWEPG